MSTVTQQEKDNQPHHLHQNIRFQVIPVSPASAVTPLQIICFFDYRKNMTMTGGSADVDSHFNGAIKALREADHFRGALFESMIIEPSNNPIPAQNLLLIGLGDPELLAMDTLQILGRIVIHEALKLGVTSISFAPDIKDAGLTGLPGGEVSASIVRGIKEALFSARSLAEDRLIAPIKLTEIIFLAGAAHLADSQAGMLAALEE